jgi:hypothetical protein
MAATLAAFFAVTLPIAVTMVPGVAASTDHYLHFPHDRIVGTVFARWIAINYEEVPWRPDHNAGWTKLSDAKGVVKIPDGTQVKLTVAGRDLTFLYDLDPDSIFFLDCRFRMLTNDELAPIAYLRGLRGLDLSDNTNLTGEALLQLGSLSELEWLDVDRTPMNGLPSGAVEQFPELRYVAGHFGDYGDQVLSEAGNLAHLEYFCTKTKKVTADGLSHLAGKESLRALVLDNVQLTDDALGTLHSLPNLSFLDLRKNPNLTDEGLGHLAEFQNLTHLNLEYCGITDAGVSRLANNIALEQIYLANTPVTELSLDTLVSLPSLHTLKLVETNIPEAKAMEVSQLVASRDGYFVPAQRSSNPDAPKIGIVMSHFTATGPHRIDRPYGYSNQTSNETARALNEANFDLYAVIEPGTERMGELPLLLREHGLAEKTIDGFNPDELSQLDAIFICACANMRNEMLVALDIALSRGVGLVSVSSIGVLTPGESAPAVERITGLQQAEYTWRGFQDSTCLTTSKHPILGELPKGTPFALNTLNGCRSASGTVVDGVVLMRAPQGYPTTFPVLYVRNHGNGRVVFCQWHRPLQSGLPYPGYTFYVRALNWVAQREVDTTW